MVYPDKRLVSSFAYRDKINDWYLKRTVTYLFSLARAPRVTRATRENP